MKEYIVRFIRADEKPNEDYYYNTIDEARSHYNLFVADDSALYSKIVITNDTGEVFAEIAF